MASCVGCSRSFKTQEALEQHTRNSPAHTGSIRDSPAHAPSHNRRGRNRPSRGERVLEQNIRAPTPDTPLNKFFQSFPSFPYDPNLPPAESYAQLQRFKGWQRGEAASKKGWKRYQAALKNEVELWFGSEDDIGAWHALCRAIGIDPLPPTRRKCKQAVRNKYVNIVDLIEWARGGMLDGTTVRKFRTLDDLREYTRNTRKIFPNTLDSSEGGNVVLRHLLRHIFRVA
ncbi:hypothetical protein AJ80_00145 [Polytolypa hystricis UAMH7299]|uniref:C2H2-type domain-containing protein n=1 Tax=Polytolypa hystricis (strain UAMH7299) TaxID=1447883 RepID=A0A2B7YVZ2_POLH7|nr:hypothetical protein AJ80_00145 [Polytolypa hystricis UAMH7299]